MTIISDFGRWYMSIKKTTIDITIHAQIELKPLALFGIDWIVYFIWQSGVCWVQENGCLWLYGWHTFKASDANQMPLSKMRKSHLKKSDDIFISIFSVWFRRSEFYSPNTSISKGCLGNWIVTLSKTQIC